MPNPGGPDSRSPPPRSPVVGELLGQETSQERLGRVVNEQWARLLSSWTDSVFEVPGLGWRFGLDPLVGLVPILGDLATTMVSFYILSLAAQLGVPRSTLARMTLNVAVDYLVGSIPIVGNLFDFAWKANQRNMVLLERALATPVHQRRRLAISDWLLLGGILALLLVAFIGSIVIAVLIAQWIQRALWS